MERLAAAGWQIEWFSGTYPGAQRDEHRDGIRYVRAGSAATVHLHAFARYARRRDFDVVVDQINTIPFFSPFYATRSIAWFQQLAREVWLYEGGKIGRVGYAAEPFYLRPYRSTPLITISPSSAESLRAIGLRGSLRILVMAVDEIADEAVPPKASPRDVVVVGRLTPSKRVEDSIEAAAVLRARGWGGRLIVVGAGPPAYRDALERRVGRLGLADAVVFRGRVDDAERSSILRNASALWMTSVREGWGLVVTEAARHGTPAIVYDVAGLRDAVSDGVTGRVVAARPEALAAATAEVFTSFDAFSSTALERSRALTWEATAASFAHAVDDLVPL
jgi:glycosyltransferase involved in cell wall biosynthesis